MVADVRNDRKTRSRRILDQHRLSAFGPAEFCDILRLFSGKLTSREKAAAIPPDFIWPRRQKQSGLPAFLVGLVVAHVSACRRENIGGCGASVPGLVAVFEAGLATIGAIGRGPFKRGNPRHH